MNEEAARIAIVRAADWETEIEPLLTLCTGSEAEILRLYFREGLRGEDIADIQGITEAMASYRFSSGLGKLLDAQTTLRLRKVKLVPETPTPRVETKLRVEPYTEKTSHLVVDVVVDGRPAGSVKCAKGYHADVMAYMRGEIDVAEMDRRKRVMQDNALRELEEAAEDPEVYRKRGTVYQVGDDPDHLLLAHGYHVVSGDYTLVRGEDGRVRTPSTGAVVTEVGEVRYRENENYNTVLDRFAEERAARIAKIGPVPVCDAISAETGAVCGAPAIQFFRYTATIGAVAFCEAHQCEGVESELTREEYLRLV